ncbi:MAG: 3-phosphoserine/phosphohydroxythreonine transaminase [Bacteroidetes bacterium]|nr:MAG: 3-phosphoserine/phosphohydroxythreonine transaminase [Bacteroidota bacterium]
MKKHNFNAGPCILPDSALQATSKAIIELEEAGLPLISISHRSKEFQAIFDETVALWKELLQIPEGYRVLFLGGGASTQFLMTPYNFLNKKAGYVESGVWAKKAIKEAEFFGEVVKVASSADKGFTYYPAIKEIPSDLDYLHLTTNNTIYGTELRQDIDCPVPLIADMSSDIMSRPVDVSKYAMIYGGAQKNVGPAGVTFVILKESMLETVAREIPTMLQYKTHVDKDSMFNTPPCFAIYTMRETLKWIKEFGGLAKLEKHNQEKAKIVYDEIDRNRMFVGTVSEESRSIMNLCFVMSEEYKDKEAEFLQFATEQGMVGVKGHRSVGGFRASTYNALPIKSAKALVACMQEFEKKHA